MCNIRYEMPTMGSMNLGFTADMREVRDEEKRNFNIDYQEYSLKELLAMPENATGIADLMFRLDNREGPVYIFLAVTSGVNAAKQAALFLDSVTVYFTHGYWKLQMSLARKQKLATLGGLKALAVVGNLATIFKSESSLLRGQAILVDLQMVYALKNNRSA